MLTKTVSQQCEYVSIIIMGSDRIVFLLSGSINLCESLKVFTSISLVHFQIR